MLKIGEFVLNYVIQAPLFLWRFFYFNAPEKYKILILQKIYDLAIVIIDTFFPPHVEGLKREIIATVIFSYIPRVIIFSVFLYEIILYKQLNIFYYVAMFLIIPLTFDSLTRIFMDFSFFELQRLERDYFKIICENNEPYNFSKAIKINIFEKNNTYGSDSRFVRINFTVSDEAYEQAAISYGVTWQIQRTAYKFFIVGEKYDYIFSLITYTLLMIGLLFWLLAMV